MLRRVVPCLMACGVAGLLAVAMQQSPVNPIAGKEPDVKDADLRVALQDAGRANPSPKNTTSRVVSVTVFPNSALVTREVDVPEGLGTIEINVRPLPMSTVLSSLYSEGADGVRVLMTRFRTRPVLEDTRDEVRKLQDEIKQLQTLRDKIEADVKATQANALLLTELENITTVTNVPASDKAMINSEAIIATVKYIMERRGENTKELVALQQQMQGNQEKADIARKKLNDLTGSTAKMENDAIIVVDKSNKAAAKIRLNYLVDSA